MTMTYNQNRPLFRLKTLSMDYKHGDIQVETTVYNDCSDWSALEFLDPLTPAYCTFEHPYLGPKELPKSLKPLSVDDSEVFPCRYLACRELTFQNTIVKHKHDRNSFYPARGDIVIEQVVLECGGWFCVGNRLKFYNMLHRDSWDSGWEPIPSDAWENKDVRIMEDGTIEAQVYLVQEFHAGVLDVLKHMSEWKYLELGRLCNVFMGEDENIDLELIHRFSRTDG